MTDRSNEADTPSLKDGAIRAEYDWLSTPPSTAIIETVADACDREPMELDPLYDVVDPDALNELLRSSRDDPGADGTTVAFEVADTSVTVHGGGTVVVRPGEAGSGDDQE
jgi:hypothetical protein